MNAKRYSCTFYYSFIVVLLVLGRQRVSAQIPAYVPTTGLLAWYNFNGNLIDATGGGSNGVVYGTVAYGTDRFGAANSCYQGSGASLADIPTHNFPLGNTARSVTVFFQFQMPYAGGGRTFFNWGDNSFGGRFGLFASDTIIGLEYVNGLVRKAFTPNGAWHNLTVTYPGSGGTSAIKLYIDGCLVVSNVFSPTASFTTAYGTWHTIGGSTYYLPAYSDSWTGKLDDIGVWNRELTAAEVAMIWGGGLSAVPLISGPGSVCAGGVTTLTASVSGGTWSSGNVSVASVSGGVVTGVASGTAIISYSIVSGCSVTLDTAMVTVVPAPTAGLITGPANICIGSTVTLSNVVSGGVWSSGSASVATVGSVSGAVSGLTSGTTIVSYTVTNSCGTATDTLAVTVTSLPSAGTITGPVNFCTGTPVTLSSTISGGTWTSSVPSIATVGSVSGVVNGLTTGTTIISYTVTNSCGSATDTQAIVVTPLPVAGIITGPAHVCLGSAITLLCAPSGGVWASSAPSVATVGSGMVTGLSPGTSIISYTITNSCGSATDTQAVVVDVFPSAGTVSGAAYVCIGSAITLTDAVTGGVWSSGSPLIATVNTGSGMVSGVAIGTAVISYTVTNSCGSATDTQAVSVGLPIITGSVSGPTNACVGSSVSLVDAVAGGIWSSGSPSVATVGITGMITGLAGGTAVISYTITNSCGTETDTQSVVVTPLPNAGTITGPPVVCVGANITLSATGALAGGVWSCGSTTVATVTGSTGVVSGISPGSATIVYTVANTCGSAASSYPITVNSLPNAGIITGPANVCINSSITLSDATAGGTWSSSTPAAATVNGSGVVNGLISGTVIISYSVTNSCGTATDTQAIAIQPLPGVGSISAPASVCLNSVITLTDAVPGGVWSSSTPTVASIDGITGSMFAHSLGTTTITYTTTSPFGCINTTTYFLTVSATGSLLVNGTATDVKCSQDSNGSIGTKIINGTGPYQYAWSNGSTSDSIGNLSPGWYTLIVTDLGTNCVDSQRYYIANPAPLDINYTIGNEQCNNGNGRIDIANIYGGVAPFSCLWSNGATTVAGISNIHGGTYSVVITDKHLCAKSFEIVVPDDSCNTITIHDVITPNGDGINDVWVIEGIQKYTGNTVQLFDKWGDIVFDTKNYNNDWSGEGKSGLLPDGTYFYLIKLNTTDPPQGGKSVMTGSLLIKR